MYFWIIVQNSVYTGEMKIVSWNVNGIRAAYKKGCMDYLTSTDADVFCLQETKAHKDQLTDEILSPPNYKSWWHSAEKKGYSGTAFWSKKEPDDVRTLGIDEFDAEGRTQAIYLNDLVILNGYFPNSQAEGARLDYKLRFNKAVQDYADNLVEQGKVVVVTGDFNVSHKPIDLARPKENEKNPGYLPEERAWMDSFVDGGWVDTFRMFDKGANRYTWWSYRAGARARNVGWRLDYFFINDGAREMVASSTIEHDILGSDHCPVTLELDR